MHRQGQSQRALRLRPGAGEESTPRQLAHGPKSVEHVEATTEAAEVDECKLLAAADALER
jgi:hypothetical protein